MPLPDSQPVICVLNARVLPKATQEFIDWQALFNSEIVRAPGLMSLEFLSPETEKNEWKITQRFSTLQEAEKWKKSRGYCQLMEVLQSYVEKKGIEETVHQEAHLQTGATEVFVTHVKEGQEDAYREWSAKVHQIEAKFPGFRSVYVQSPRTGTKGHWITFLQFDSTENLDQWLNSLERKALLSESNLLVASLESNRVFSSYGGWFSSLAKKGTVPSTWKQTMVVLLVLFPIVMLQIKYLFPLLSSLPESVQIFIGNALSVFLIAFIFMPPAIFCLSWWLIPKESTFLNISGTLFLFFLYFLEILFFL